MELSQFFKSIIDEDKGPVVICDLNHQILYMNPTACVRYGKRGGAALIGKSLLNCHNSKSNELLSGFKQVKKTIEFIFLIMKKKIEIPI